MAALTITDTDGKKYTVRIKFPDSKNPEEQECLPAEPLADSVIELQNKLRSMSETLQRLEAEVLSLRKNNP